MIALDTGILKLSGVHLYDALSEQRFDVGSLGDIFVQPAEEVVEVENTSGSARTKGAAYLVFSTENAGMLVRWSARPQGGATASFGVAPASQSNADHAPPGPRPRSHCIGATSRSRARSLPSSPRFPSRVSSSRPTAAAPN